MISIVIPTFNEAEGLPRTLDALAAAAGRERYEVVVADGGSTDNTVELAASCRCVCVHSHLTQRAAQLNTGTACAHGQILIFLHADTLLPPGALEGVRLACARPGVVGGGFARRYDSPSRWLRVTCWLAEWRNRWFGWHLGDQAIFAERAVFEELGGFRDMDIFEDVDFSRRLGRRGKLVTLYPPAVSSARRFCSRGPLRTSLRDFWWTWCYLIRSLPAFGRKLW